MITNFVRRVAGAAYDAASGMVSRVLKLSSGADEPAAAPTTPAVTEDRPLESSPSDEPFEAVTPFMETRGSGRDERSFEQRRRGGPMTGEAPAKIHGPRHGGGGKRRGRDESPEANDALFLDLPFDDYDELPVTEIESRLKKLDRAAVRAVLDYETQNKHRKSLIDTLEKRLAA